MSKKKERELESDRVARILREDIMFGRRLPGSRLVEREIAEELQVSRLPVREAIQVLVNEGVVTARPRTWAVVRTFTLKELRDFVVVRESIETIAFTLTAQKVDEEGLAQLRVILDREQAAILAGDAGEAQQAAWEFHRNVMGLADNDTISELMGVFFTRLRWLFGQHVNLEDAAAEHRRLWEALAVRDVETILQIVPKHLEADARFAESRLKEAQAL